METYDDDLRKFEADGAPALSVANDQGYVGHDGARICYATYGSGSPVIMLHGGLGHSGNWGYQVPALIKSGYRAVLTTAPYYRSSYVFAVPKGSGKPIESFNDPRLRRLKIGVQVIGEQYAPPAHWCA